MKIFHLIVKKTKEIYIYIYIINIFFQVSQIKITLIFFFPYVITLLSLFNFINLGRSYNTNKKKVGE